MRLATYAITQDREYKQAMLVLAEQYRASKPLPISASGLSDGAIEAFLVEALREVKSLSNASRLVFVKDESEGRSLAAFLSAEGENACYFPARDLVFLNITSSHDTERERLSVLCRLLAGESLTVVTTPFAALLRTPPPDALRENCVSLRVSDEISPALLAERLVRMGFAPVDLVESAGQFAKRGGIFDVYAAGMELPVRLEFFGDEIDRIEYFDPISQRVTAPCDCLSLCPARESLWDAEQRKAMIAAHRALLAKADGEAFSTLHGELAVLEGEGDIPFADRYMALLYPECASLLSYLGEERTVIFFVGEGGTRERVSQALKALAKTGDSIVSRGLLAPRYHAFFSAESVLDEFLSRHIPFYITGFGGDYHGALAGLFGFRTRRTVSYFGKESLLCEDIETLISGYYRTVVLCENENEADAVYQMLTDRGAQGTAT